jgi:hypothetical protein
MHSFLALVATVVAALPLAAAGPVSLPRRDDTCSSRSVGGFSWTVENFDFHATYTFTTPAHQNSYGWASFNLTNPAVPYKATCSAMSSQLQDFFYGTQVFTCSVPDGAPKGAGATTFDFSRSAGALRLNQSWTCFDDPQWP